MRFSKVVDLFRNNSVSVCGLRGKGKDMLMSNVIARRNEPYVSNMPYGYDFHLLDFDKIDCGGNTYSNFISGDILPYSYPYPKGADIYLSDAGIYLPSQYVKELNKRYPHLSTFQALIRHVGRCNFHFNAQNLERVYDKVREQSEVYIRCEKCIVLFGKFVIQRVTIYDTYDSAVARVKPCRVRMPLFASGERKERVLMYLDDFYNKHGSVRSRWLFYIHKGKYDTHYFETLLGGKKDEN